MIPYARQDIDEADIAAVVEVLRSDWLTQGPAIERFEAAVAQYCGARFAVAMSSATAALHAACAALGAGPGDQVWTSPNSFVASANCARYCGAEVDFVDIDPGTLNLCPDALADRLERAAVDGRAPKIVIPVHFAGQSCDMTRIGALRERHGFRVIEDASHAIGGRFDDVPVGACRHSDITVFSFHPVKILTSGEGGMAVTNDPELAIRLREFRSHGITRDPARMHESDGPWYYEQLGLGYNYRMTDMQAALGASQLNRIDAFVARRRLLADRYEAALDGPALTTAARHPRAASAWHLFVIRVQPARRRQVFEALVAGGIRPNVHYIPIHLQPYYRALGFRPGDFPAAEAYYAGAITLPLYYGLGEDAQDRVVETLREALR